jgi:transposase-like protein
VETRLEEARHGMLVMIGADAKGQKELVDLWDGSRESEPSWQALLLAPQSRGRAQAPAGASDAGALGGWKALRHV